MTEMHEKAAELLIAIWRGVPADYKSRYRASIWQQFEDNVRSAAYTSNLGKFVNSLCAKLQAQIKAGDVQESEKILNSGQDKKLLKLLRDETTLLVLMVRLANQERQEEWRAKQEEIDEQKQAMEDPLFGLPKKEETE